MILLCWLESQKQHQVIISSKAHVYTFFTTLAFKLCTLTHEHSIYEHFRTCSTISCFISCDQAALWIVQSVHPSVRPFVCLSVCLSVTPFSLCSCPHVIMKFSEVITIDRSDVHAKGQGQGHRGHDPTKPFPDCKSSLNSHMAMKLCTKLDVA